MRKNSQRVPRIDHAVQALSEEVVGHGELRNRSKNAQVLHFNYLKPEGLTLPKLPEAPLFMREAGGFAGPTQ